MLMVDGSARTTCPQRSAAQSSRTLHQMQNILVQGGCSSCYTPGMMLANVVAAFVSTPRLTWLAHERAVATSDRASLSVRACVHVSIVSCNIVVFVCMKVAVAGVVASVATAIINGLLEPRHRRPERHATIIAMTRNAKQTVRATHS
jgi:hypothetical protein